MIGRSLAALLALLAASAMAEPLRDLCPTRPGLGTAPCIIDKGHFIAELGVGAWTLEKDQASRTDSFILGDLLVRYGLDEVSEVQAGWTAFGHVRTRDKVTGHVAKASGAGDLTIAYKRSLAHPDGGGFSLAVQPFVSLPTGGRAIGSGQWGVGALMPISQSVGERIQLQLTPEIDANGDEGGHGHQVSYGSVAGLGFDILQGVNVDLEMSAFRNYDPSGHTTELLAAASAAWQPKSNLQLDVGGDFGLNRSSPDAVLYLGVSRRF